MRLVQFIDTTGARRVGVPSDDGYHLRLVQQRNRVYDLALEAHRRQIDLAALVHSYLGDQTVEYDAVIAEKRILPPLDHSDSAHFVISGTGLDHMGSAMARNAMHTSATSGETDSMKMFRIGLEGGKPQPGQVGAQPEWFYKGDGSIVVPPEQPLDLPPFALDGGEEAELVGLYVIGDGGEVLCIGYALGNEYADHVMERQNYLYLAHSKLRQCSFGPELRIGAAPKNIRGRVSVIRDGATLWSDEMQTGEEHMTYWLSVIEHHHFKYAQFRRAGDVHAHYFGASALSCANGITTQPGDVFEIEAEGFGRALRNGMKRSASEDRVVGIQQL